MSNTSKVTKLEKQASMLWPLVLLLTDYVAIIAAEELAYRIRYLVIYNPTDLHISWVNFWLVFPFLFIVFLSTERLYGVRRQFWRTVQCIFKGCIYATFAIIVEMYLARTATNTSRLFILLFGVNSFILITLFRFWVKVFLAKRQLLQLPILVVGAGKTAESFEKVVSADDGLNYKIIGFLEDNVVYSKRLKKYPVLGGFDDIERVILETGVKHIIIAAPSVDPAKQGELIYRVQPLVKNIAIIPNLIGMPMGGLEVESFFNEKLMLLKLKNNLARPWNRLVKNIFDYTLTFFGTIAISPILLGIAFWIYKEDPGPILFKHMRVGKDGKIFPCYKFRSMCLDADKKLKELLAKDSEARAEWEKDFKLKNDPRITKIGAFLRRTSLDELPQIFNVLRGEMSLVGPRPIIEEELPRYGNYVREYLAVKPGITGYWQVNGRSDTTYEERVAMDTWYVQNWSVWLDLMLLWRTFKSVAKQEGAY
ncbi:MAG: undecaprenyl-phosphate galactose phosphotransferase WbaP [Phascolarctobacterium sp.]|nr:undecaprenyl-phosphate galactose phosphotransferase WbaP [Phascolarctobacterium sp.]